MKLNIGGGTRTHSHADLNTQIQAYCPLRSIPTCEMPGELLLPTALDHLPAESQLPSFVLQRRVHLPIRRGTSRDHRRSQGKRLAEQERFLVQVMHSRCYLAPSCFSACTKSRIVSTHIRSCVLENYLSQITDNTDTTTCIRTNIAFAKHKLPYQKVRDDPFPNPSR